MLVLGCLVPIVGVQLYSQFALYEQRQTQLGTLALRQAELANGDLASIVDGIRQLSTVIGSLPELAGPGGASRAACGDRLAALQRNLAAYRFFAVADPAGKVICASAPALPGGDAPPAWMAGFVADPMREIGEYGAASGIDGGFLPVRTPMPNGRGMIVAALDLRWLSRHLQETQLERTPLLPNSTLVLTDRNGLVIARFPEGEQWMGHRLPDSLAPLLKLRRPSTSIVVDEEGRRQLAAYIPANLPPVGLIAIETLSLAELMARTDAAFWRDAMLLAAAALVAAALAWVVGRRFIQRPTEALIAAAERWGQGDLHARADASDTTGEFGVLARAFNAMATSLEFREREQRVQAEMLEARVAERSRALSENNNRLQVEIAEREKTEAALTHAQKLQAVGQLAGGIAHDFNNLLATILGSLELMERRVEKHAGQIAPPDLERLQVLIGRATSAVQRGADLTTGLLRFSRRKRVSARPTDLNRLIEELVILATATLGRRVRLTTELTEAPWPAQVDPAQVEAAILNLCLNARDAMPDGGTLTIRTSNLMVTHATSGADDTEPGEYVCVEVADTGIGMTPEVQLHAFDPFFTTKGDGGSGLGLSQVRELVRQSGGTVRLRSTPGVGTEIVLLLPRAAAEPLAEQPARAGGAPQAEVPVMTVLVVDDDAAVRQVTVEMLRDLGCDVQEAPGGHEALDLLARRGPAPDIVLLDYAMPAMNGLVLARRLRDGGMRTPIAMVTGYAELSDLAPGESPLDGLLRKPFSIQDLQALLIRLGGRTRERSNVVRLHLPHRG